MTEQDRHHDEAETINPVGVNLQGVCDDRAHTEDPKLLRLPWGVFDIDTVALTRHGNGWRCWYVPEPGAPRKKSPTFADRAVAAAFKIDADHAVRLGRCAPDPTGYVPVLVPPSADLTFRQLIHGPWWNAYIRGKLPKLPGSHGRGVRPNAKTTRATELFIARHLDIAPFADEPVRLVSGATIDDWFDRRIARCPYRPTSKKQHSAGVPDVQCPAELADLLWASRPQLTKLHWVVDTAMQTAAMLGIVASNPVLPLTGLEPDIAREFELQARTRKARRSVQARHLKPIYDSLGEADRITLACCLFLGCRVSEAFGLRIRDIDFDTGKVWIRNQADHYVDRHGVTHTFRERTKTPAGTRYVYAAKAVLAAFRDHLVRMYGPEDQWPALAPLCVTQRGEADNPIAAVLFRTRLTARITDLGLDVDWDYDNLKLHASPHDFRAAISGLLHASRDIEGRALSAFMGHAVPDAWDSFAGVTRRYYVPLVDASVRRIADVIGNFIDEEGIELGPPTLPDAMTVPQAAGYTGYSETTLRTYISNGTLSAITVTALPIGVSHRRTSLWIEREVLDRFVAGKNPAPEIAITERAAATLLGVRAASDVARMVLAGELDTFTPERGSGIKPGRYITTASLQHRIQGQEFIDCGLALGRKEACARARLSYRTLLNNSAGDDRVWLISGVRWFHADLVDELSTGTEENTVTLDEVRRRAHVTMSTLFEIAGARFNGIDRRRTLTPIDIDLAEDVIADARRERRAVTSSKQNPRPEPRIFTEAPDPDVWRPASEIAHALNLTVKCTLDLFTQRGLPWARRRSTAYVARHDAERLFCDLVPVGWSTVTDTAEKCGLSKSAITDKVARGDFRARALGRGLPGLLINTEDVDAWVARNRDTSTVTLASARDMLGCSRRRLAILVERGEITVIGDTSTKLGRRRARIRRAEVADLARRARAQQGLLRVSEFSAELQMRGMIRSPQLIAYDCHSRHIEGAVLGLLETGWRIPPERIDEFVRRHDGSLLSTGELLRRLGLDPSAASYPAQLIRQAAERGELPGVTRPVKHGKMRVPVESVSHVRAMLTAAGYLPQSQGPDDIAMLDSRAAADS